eukprot:CAMPEP_0197550034 /NCGR_PEP_ID=MMETSP1320-20131121/3763_1 /TAXON_ID=91990 /ORGANISM="Bolidomonas sp., Strain RCC2347" /LENGTH=127 /DNA_ID=CAMNT_0043110345 /DNA_START=90 /DNA_END=470 /DNA_ORIENTATION=+
MNVPFGTVPGFLPGAASLVEQLDKRVLLVLRDGRHITGVVRSFDQFSNVVLEDAKERKFAFSVKKYADKHVGIYVVRGDSVIVLGEIEDDGGAGMTKVTVEELDDVLENEVDEEEEERLKVVWEFDQ